MSKLKHREKLRLARRMQTKDEKRLGYGAFVSSWWWNRASDIAARVIRREKLAQSS